MTEGAWVPYADAALLGATRAELHSDQIETEHREFAMKANLISWGVFAAFVTCAIGVGWHATLFRFDGPMGAAKLTVWLAFLLFTAYSVYCSSRENIFKTIRTMARLHWGRQIGTDLYLGLLLFLAVIYLHQGSALVLAAWLIPVLLFANLATLLYVAIHFESLMARFVA
jgi:hypothetical protein